MAKLALPLTISLLSVLTVAASTPAQAQAPAPPPIQHYFEKLDADAVAKRVAEFMISGTGGPQVYRGPDLTTSHRSMKLTNRDFVLAGGDVAQAMKNLKDGPEEIDEVVCTLVSLRSQVVLD